MKVHNVMEEYVEDKVNIFYNKLLDEKVSWLTCDCDTCRSDTLGYVLNRIPPRYVVSSRGVTHNYEFIKNSQLNADVDTLISQGVHKINSVQRPYHAPNRKILNTPTRLLIPSFNFPVIAGKIYDGTTFEPLPDVTMTLKNTDGDLTEMFDSTWENPYTTRKVADCTYTFWIRPLSAEKEGENKTFHFVLEASLDGYSPVMYGFDVPIVSEKDRRENLSSSYSLKIPDLFMFRTDEENSME